MTKPKTDSTRDQCLAKHEEFILGAVSNYYAEPVVLESGQGRNVTDIEGRTYLDFFGGILTVSVGHCDERITGPMKTQIDRLGHVSTLYPTLPIVELAERLARITPGRLQKSMFTASGTEADETAVALAQVYTGSIELIALRHGYSGRSLLAQALTGHAPWRSVPTQVAGIKHAHAPYCYRCPLKLEYPSCGVACATDIEDLIRTTTTGRIAGFWPSRFWGWVDSSFHRPSIFRLPPTSSASTGEFSFATKCKRALAEPVGKCLALNIGALNLMS